jgi:hypothetical protein
MKTRTWSVAIIILTAAAMFATLTNVSRAHSHWYTDQQQTSGNFNAFPVDYWAQTFRTGPTVDNILGFDLDFYNANGSPFSFQIRKVAGYSVVWTTATMPMNNGLQHIHLGSRVPLEPETDYELRVFDSTPNFSGDYAVRGAAAANYYTRGTARFPGGGNDSFGHDWYFRTYWIPEPASAVMLGTGMVGLLGVLRRRDQRSRLYASGARATTS